MSNRTIDPDDFILRMLADNDEHAITMLFDRYYQIIFDVVNQRLKNPEDANDLIQELFINIWVKRHTLNFKKPIIRYLMKSAINRTRNHLRDKRRQHEIPLDRWDEFENTWTSTPADSGLSAEEIKRLWKEAQSKMTGRIRISFLLNRKFSMTYSEIAQYLGVSQKAVEKYISQALTILREVFAAYLKVIVPILFLPFGS
ncbi:MAG: sigma-70 family RNA polymerase sigma factor [Cyclobacteriaceae bacterium]